MFFITTNKDKPIKIIFENNNNTSSKTEKYKLTLKEVLINELKYNYNLRKILTRQQIHTERGKIKNGNYNEVINFLVKRGISKEYIENEVNQERERTLFTIKTNIPISNVSGTLGIINLQ